MQTVLDHVAKREGFSIPEDTVKLIAEDANGNLRKALLVLEALKMQKYAFSLLASNAARSLTCAVPTWKRAPSTSQNLTGRPTATKSQT